MHDDHAAGLCELPDAIAASRPLAEAHRLDLALFVVFEEWSVEVAHTLMRHAKGVMLAFLTRQAQDDTRHLAVFGARLDQSLAVKPAGADRTQALLLRVLQSGERTTAALRREEIVNAVIVPPLRRFLDRVRSLANTGDSVEALSLLNLVFKGMACPLSRYEVRFWEKVDPFLSFLIRGADADERRHVTDAARILRTLLAGDAARRGPLLALCEAARAELAEAFRYYARKMVGLSSTYSKQLFEGRTSDDMLTLLLSAGVAGCTEALHQAGLDEHG
jgi:hypothetical protein